MDQFLERLRSSQTLGSFGEPKNRDKLQCILVFPKAFEEHQFLASLVDLGFTIQGFSEGKFQFNVIHWEAVGSVLAIQTVSFDTSDVLFTGSLVELIQQKQSVSNLSLILCGTCGADAFVAIGACFEIKEAMKIDRGDMRLLGKGVQIELRPTMRVTLKPNHKSFHQSATAICSNYVMHDSPSVLYEIATGRPKNGKDVVVADMETFEFFMICEKTNIKQYRALRVVSDTTFHDQSKDLGLSKDLKRSIRKAIPMRSLVLMVNKLVSEELATGGSSTYPEHVKARILRAAKVRFESINRPKYDDAVQYYGTKNVVDLATQWEEFETDLAVSRGLFAKLPHHEKFDTEEGKTESAIGQERQITAIDDRLSESRQQDHVGLHVPGTLGLMSTLWQPHGNERKKD